MLPREELTAPPVHLVLGAGGPAGAPTYLLPSVRDAIPGDVNCAGESVTRAKPGAFVTLLPACCLFAPCQGSWTHLRGCPAPSISHLSSLHPLIHADRQRGSGARGEAKHPVPIPAPNPALPAHGSRRAERESRAARREGRAHAAACCQRALVSSHERSHLSEAAMLSNCLDLKIRAI